jgi:hypothetical protein
MGLDETDVLMVENAILTGTITTIDIITNLVPAPPGMVA